jgi:hypothetical protein
MHVTFPTTVSEISLLGLDSFVASLLIGPMLASRWKRAGLAATFGLCDGLASVAGAAAPHVPTPPEVLVYAGIVVIVALAARVGAVWLLLVPCILAIDNLASGAPASDAPLLAISSAIAAFAGMAASGVTWSIGRPLSECAPLRRSSEQARSVGPLDSGSLGEWPSALPRPSAQ